MYFFIVFINFIYPILAQQQQDTKKPALKWLNKKLSLNKNYT